jgi:hypothetical protein
MTGIIMAPLAVGEDFDNLDDDEEEVDTQEDKCNNANAELGTNHGSGVNSGQPHDDPVFDSSDWFSGEFLRGFDGIEGDSQLKISNTSNCAKSKKDKSNNNCVKGDVENERNCSVISCNSTKVSEPGNPGMPGKSGSRRPCTHSRSASNPVQISTNHEFFPTTFKRTSSSSSSEFCSSPTSTGESITSPTRTSSQAVLRGRQARWEMQSSNKPIARPRSTTPISIATYDDYVSYESKTLGRQESLSPVNKLRIVLPGEEFEPRIRSPRKSPKKPPGETLWSNLDETGLFSRSAIISDAISPLKSPKRIVIPSSLPTSPGSRNSVTTPPNNWILFNDDEDQQLSTDNSGISGETRFYCHFIIVSDCLLRKTKCKRNKVCLPFLQLLNSGKSAYH